MFNLPFYEQKAKDLKDRYEKRKDRYVTDSLNLAASFQEDSKELDIDYKEIMENIEKAKRDEEIAKKLAENQEKFKEPETLKEEVKEAEVTK